MREVEAIRERLAAAWQAGAERVDVTLIEDLRLHGEGTKIEWSLDTGEQLEGMQWHRPGGELRGMLSREVRRGTGLEVRLGEEPVSPEPWHEREPHTSLTCEDGRIDLHRGDAEGTAPVCEVWAEGRSGMAWDLPGYQEPVGRIGRGVRYWTELVVARGVEPVEWDGELVQGPAIARLRGQAEGVLERTMQADRSLMQPGGPIRRLPRLSRALAYEGKIDEWHAWHGETTGAICRDGAIGGLAKAQAWRIETPLYAPGRAHDLYVMKDEPWLKGMKALRSITLDVGYGGTREKIEHDLDTGPDLGQGWSPKWEEQVVLARHRAQHRGEPRAIEVEDLQLVLAWSQEDREWEDRIPIDHALVPWDRGKLGLEAPGAEWAYLRRAGEGTEPAPTIAGLSGHLWRTIGRWRHAELGAESVREQLRRAVAAWLA